MWESPINIIEIQDSFVSEIKEKTEEMVFTEIKRIGIEVDKEELIKALQYDREQYEKGYKDGYVKAIDNFAEKFIYKAVCEGCSGCCGCYEESRQSECEDWKSYMEIAEQLKGE